MKLFTFSLLSSSLLLVANSFFLPLPTKIPTTTTTTSLPSTASSSTFSLPTYLSHTTPFIESTLSTSLEYQSIPQTSKITQAMYYSLLAGGKRIRPVACLLSYDMFRSKREGKVEEESLEERYKAVMPTAVSLEMIHTMSLIHDDLPSMDDDDLRRGKPTCHVVYGEDVAILAGDSLLSSAFEYAIKYTPIPSISGENKAERLLDVVGRLGASVGNIGLAGGQVMDLECEGKPSEEVTIEDLRWIHLHKTAALLKVACASGAILGGASESDVAKVETFAEKIGLAFQVADDILDCTASSEELGKTAGKDEMVDKATYVRLLGLEGAKAEAQKLTDEAKECLSEWGEEADGLRAIADFIISRSN